MKWLFIFLAIFFTFTGIACSPFVAFSRSEPAPVETVIVITQESVTSKQATLLAPTETPVLSPSYTATTYKDEAEGFEFDYPDSWALDQGEQQSRGYYVQFYSWDWQPGTPVESIPDGETVLSVAVQLWDPKNDLEAFVNQRKLAWDSSGISILFEERIVLAGNRLAAQFIVQGSDGVQAFFLLTTNRDNYLALSGNGNLNLLAEIAHTIRTIQ